MEGKPSKIRLFWLPRYLADTSFFSSSSIIFAGSFVVNVLNYVFTIIIGRMLGIEAFGEVTALFSLMVIVTVPATALTMLMAREAAFRGTEGTDAVRDLFALLRKHVFAASIIFWVIFLCASPFLAGFLHLELTPLLIFSALIPITLASSLQSGTLQGLQEFFLLSKQSVLSTLVKLGASLALVYAGLSVIGVMVGLVVATLASWGYGYLATHRIFGTGEALQAQPPMRSSFRALFATILITTLLLVLLSNVDVLLVKHFLSAELAGHYGALSTLGKILVYGVGAFITVLLPMVSAAEAEGMGKGRNILALSLVIISGASIAAYACFSLFPNLIVTLLFGERYLDIAPYLGLFSLAMACISLSTAFINYFVAVKNTSFIYFLVAGIAAQVSLISLYHSSLGAVTAALLVSSMLLLTLMLGNYVAFCRKPL